MKQSMEEFFKEHAPMTYQAWKVYEETTCCNHKCNQGRECPLRKQNDS